MKNMKDYFEPRLPFPTRIFEIPTGSIEVYIIPDKKKVRVLNTLFPFIPVPSLDQEMLDIHADKKFRVKEFMVTREDGMNMLVSPFYFESGGSVIDWIPTDSED